MLAMAALVAQLYAGVYLGWFTIVGLGLAAVVALAMRPCRVILLEVVRRDAWAIAAAVASGIVLLQPFLSHYLAAARMVGSQYPLLMRGLHPNVISWLDVGPKNWLWGPMVHPGWPYKLKFLEDEHFLGIGLLTSIACVTGLYLGRKWPICPLAAVATVIVWLATTYLPGTNLAIVATGVSVYCAAGLFYETDRPNLRIIGLAALVCPVLLIRFPNPCVIVLGLTAIAFCLLEIARMRERDLIAPGIALLAISVKLFDPEVILYGVIVIVPMAGLLAYYWRSGRLYVGLGALAFLILFSVVITFADRPRILLAGLAGAPLALALSAPRRYRPPAGLLMRAMLIASPFLVLFYGQSSLWLNYSGMIPGAVAIRAIGRVVLILLIPAALGLACLVQYLDQRRFVIASWIVVMVCLGEQVVTTDTFDAAANRASIDSLTRRIDLGRVAFYYHPDRDASYPFDHLDAMWSSLEARVPTVNGYTGHTPRPWHGFFAIEIDPDANVEAILAEWERSQGLLPNHVQWIGSATTGSSKSETRLDPPGNLSTPKVGSK